MINASDIGNIYQLGFKRCFLLVLAAVALFSGTQQPSCTCYNMQANCISTVNEHECCRANHCSSLINNICLGKSKHCCGMVNNHVSATGNSVRVISEKKEYLYKLITYTNQVYSLEPVLNRFSLSWTNRAPPDIKGFGSSKTYLYKHVFLI